MGCSANNKFIWNTNGKVLKIQLSYKNILHKTEKKLLFRNYFCTCNLRNH